MGKSHVSWFRVLRSYHTFICIHRPIVLRYDLLGKWAATWQNQQSECAPSEDSDQPGHPPSLIRVLTVRMKKLCFLSYPLSASEDSNQLGRMPRLIWVVAGRTLTLLVLSCRGWNVLFLLQTTPPQYYPGNITVPVALYSGENDWLVTPTEMQQLVPQIKHLVENIVIDEWDHIDFMWGMDAPKQCYNGIIKLFRYFV